MYPKLNRMDKMSSLDNAGLLITSSDLNQHEIIVCIECDKIFKAEEAFLDHFKTCRSNKSEYEKDKKVNKCEICFEIFSTKGNLKKHRKLFHFYPPDEEQQCPFCDKFKLNKSIKKLFRHIELIHDSENENELFQKIANEYDLYMKQNGAHCDQCGNVFSCSDSLRNHIQNIHESENIVCSECADIFKSKSSLRYHMAVKHSKVTITCEHCGHLYKEKRKLDRHIQTKHMQVKKYECNLCSTKFADASKLRIHKLEVHEKLKPFKCLDCKFRTARYGNLNLHRRNSHGKQNMPKPEYDGIVNGCGSK